MRKKVFLPLAVIFGLVGAGDVAGMNSENEFIQQAREQAVRAQVPTAAAIMVSNYGDLQSPVEQRFVNKLFELKFTENVEDPILELRKFFLAPENVELLGCDPGMDGTAEVKVFLRGKRVYNMDKIFNKLRMCTVEDVTLEEIKRPLWIAPLVRSKYEGDVPNYGGSFKRSFEITQMPYSKEPVCYDDLFDLSLEAIETRTFRGKRAILRLFYFIINEYASEHGETMISIIDGISTHNVDVYSVFSTLQSLFKFN